MVHEIIVHLPMLQIFTCYPTLARLSVLLPALWLVGCDPASSCRPLEGTWTDQEGQELVFNTDGNAIWLTRFGSLRDTVTFSYALNCSAQPYTLDLSNFKGGPHDGKNLYGIIEWLSDSSFRFRFEAGLGTGVRPEEFDEQQSVKFIKVPSSPSTQSR